MSLLYTEAGLTYACACGGSLAGLLVLCGLTLAHRDWGRFALFAALLAAGLAFALAMVR